MSGGARSLNAGAWTDRIRVPSEVRIGSEAQAIEALRAFVGDMASGRLAAWLPSGGWSRRSCSIVETLTVRRLPCPSVVHFLQCRHEPTSIVGIESGTSGSATTN